LGQPLLSRIEGRRDPASRIAADLFATLHPVPGADSRRAEFTPAAAQLRTLHQRAHLRGQEVPIPNRDAVDHEAGIAHEDQRLRRSDRSAIPTRRSTRFLPPAVPAARRAERRAGVCGFLAGTNMVPRQFVAPQRHA